MPRSRRVHVPGFSFHIMNRGHNRSEIFDEPIDYEIFLHLLQTAAARHGLDVHSFTLMTNHFHLQVTPQDARTTASTMKEVAAKYCRYYNKKHGRIGSIWNGRYKSVLIESSWQWLVCLRYIELNPVVAGIVDCPDKYRWTSYRTHAHGSSAYDWLTDHRVLQGLGSTDEERQQFYRSLCATPLTEAELALMRHPLNMPARALAPVA